MIPAAHCLLKSAPNISFERSGISGPFMQDLPLAKMFPARSIRALGARMRDEFPCTGCGDSVGIDCAKCRFFEATPEWPDFTGSVYCLLHQKSRSRSTARAVARDEKA